MSGRDDPFPFGPTRRELRRVMNVRDRRRVGRRRALAAVVLSGGLLVGTGGAFAFFSSSGTGTASVAVPDPSIAVAAGPATATALYPGAVVPAEIVVAYDGPGLFTVTDVAGSAAASSTGCPGDAVRLVAPTSLPTMTASGTATITVDLEMALDAPPACQDTVFTVPATVDGRIG